ncbi:hypothetical protein [Kineococcus sp. SYSU DK003]|uniref:hypothetical protein n=1 Tax=Kineococcus sp. SYSU DK003 TaxID=3383124 RepID=UPI003D7E3E86
MNRKIARYTLLPLAGLGFSAAALLGTGAAANAATPAQSSTTAVAATSSAGAGNGSQSTHSTAMTINLANNTDQDLTLVSSSNPYGSWKTPAPQTIKAHTTGTMSDTSSNIEGAQIDATYALPDGTQVSIQGLVPLVGSNGVSGSTTNPAAYTLHGQSASGWSPTFNFQLSAK